MIGGAHCGMAQVTAGNVATKMKMAAAANAARATAPAIRDRIATTPLRPPTPTDTIADYPGEAEGGSGGERRRDRGRDHLEPVIDGRAAYLGDVENEEDLHPDPDDD